MATQRGADSALRLRCRTARPARERRRAAETLCRRDGFAVIDPSPGLRSAGSNTPRRPLAAGTGFAIYSGGLGNHRDSARSAGVCMPPSPPKLCVDDVSMTFRTPAGAFHALAPVTLSIPAGRFVSLIGPSGCGKSTIFNIIAGLLEPTAGKVRIDGVDATGAIGRVGYMLQKDLLLPWRSVVDNVILGMEIQGVPLKEARARALTLLNRYGLSGFEHLHPGALSGGMRQRAALLRTLLFDTDV